LNETSVLKLSSKYVVEEESDDGVEKSVIDFCSTACLERLYQNIRQRERERERENEREEDLKFDAQTSRVRDTHTCSRRKNERRERK
jgi:hypothetical protein